MKPIIISLIMILSSTANAMTVSDYRSNLKNSPEFVYSYINGVGNGYSWMSIMYKANGTLPNPTFCQPGNLALNEDNYIRIINDEIVERAKQSTPDKINGFHVELMLLAGLERTFPCQ